MKTHQMVLIIVITVILLSIASYGSVPAMISYQGRLTDTSGEPVTGMYSIKFRVYTFETDGIELWSSDGYVGTEVTDGLFQHYLGESRPLPDSLSKYDSLWLGIQIYGEPTEITPRTRLVSMPYALKASYAETSTNSDTAQVALNVSPQAAYWTPVDSVLYTTKYWGIARGSAGNNLLGDSAFTHINLGVASTSGLLWGTDQVYSTIGGGINNSAASYATVCGGTDNCAEARGAVIGGGSGNVASQSWTTIGGGVMNTADNGYAVIGGGISNTISSINTSGTIAGGSQNSVTAEGGTVSGGSFNTAGGMYSSVVGKDNTSSGQYSVVSGGWRNTSGGYASTVSGGDSNAVYGDHSTIVGGHGDTITSNADYSYLFGKGSTLTKSSTFMVDMPHIRFGDESTGYEFPDSDGTSGQTLTTDGAGQLSWQNPAASSSGVVPVGAVVAWVKSFPNTPSLPENFVECNGQTITDPNSPFDGQTIPALNGNDDSSSLFLRGCTSSGGTGGTVEHSHGTAGMLRGGSEAPITANSVRNHIPPYYEVVWIMRIK